ncbi:Centromere/kinetochore protein zw10 [Blyttiomyces sp. JEL0837]|nr:Centromere/kinetochore protein zw10 [Blyttiomyces sp. JEL0837]
MHSSRYIEYIHVKDYTFDFQEEILTIQDIISSARKALQNKPGGMQGGFRRSPYDAQIQMLALLEKIDRELNLFEMAMVTKELTGAATIMTDAKAFLEELEDFVKVQQCPVEIYQALKKDFLAKRANLKHRLDELFRSCVLLTRKNGITELTITTRITSTAGAKYHDAPVTLSDLLKSMENAGLLSLTLTSFIEDVMERLIVPIAEDATQSLVVTKSRYQAKLKFGDIKSLKSSQIKPKMDLAETFTKILTTSNFLRDNFFSNSKTYESQIDKHVYISNYSTLLLSTLHKHLLKTLIPTDMDGLRQFHSTAGELLISFDRDMKHEGHLYHENMELIDFVGKMPLLYCRLQRSCMLVGVREIVEEESMDTVAVCNESEGRGGPFALCLEKMGGVVGKGSAGSGGDVGAVSGGAGGGLWNRLVLCGRIGRGFAIELFYCARDVLDMFRALMPCVHEDALYENPLRTAVFYNDCVYISYHLLTLAFKYRDGLPTLLKKLGTFVDMVPSFRSLGEGIFRRQMRRQRDKISFTLKEAGGFEGLSKDERLEAVETSPVLPPDLYLRSMGLLVDFMVGEVMAQVKALSRTSKDDAHQLRYVLGLLSKLETCFERRVNSNCGGRPPGAGRKGTVKVGIDAYVPLWPSFLVLSRELPVDVVSV